MAPLMLACYKGSVSLVSLFVHKGAQVNAQCSSNGWTALMYAVIRLDPQNYEIVKLLSGKFGADVNVRNNLEKNCCDLAVACNNTHLLPLLRMSEMERDSDVLGSGSHLLHSQMLQQKVQRRLRKVAAVRAQPSTLKC